MPILVPYGFLTPKKDEQTDAHDAEIGFGFLK